jgi:Domain of unknown function (DUF4160)
MPSVSRFLGIIIYFYYRDHNPPHFHAIYGEFEAEIIIEDLLVDVGYLPPRVLGIVMEWASLHKTELVENWEIGRSGGTFKQIAPLI